MLGPIVRRTLALIVAASFLVAGAIAAQSRGFVPGDRTLFVLDLAGAPGGLPAGIQVRTGSLELVDKDGLRMLRASAPSEFLVQLPEVLPDTFTIEFDLVPKHCCAPEDLSFEGTAAISRSSASAHVVWQPDQQLVVGGGEYFQAAVPAALRDQLPGQLTKIAVSVQGTTLRMYTNGQRLYTLTDRRFARGSVLRVFLGGQDDDQQAVFLARLRIASESGFALATPVASSGQASSAAPIGMSGLVVTTDAQKKATLSWGPVPGATSYVALRWMANDLACCNNVSPPGASASTSWLDGVLPKDGTYTFRLYATTPSGITMGETQVNYANGVVRPVGATGAAGSGTIATAVAPPVVRTPTAAQAGTVPTTSGAPPTSDRSAAAPTTSSNPPPATQSGTVPTASRTPPPGARTPVPSKYAPLIPAQGAALKPSSATPTNCPLLQIFQATPMGPSSVGVTLPTMTPRCDSIAIANKEWLAYYMLEREVPGSGNYCPSTYADFYSFSQDSGVTYKSPKYPGCLGVFLHGYDRSYQDFGLDAGTSYTYRLFPFFGAPCAANTPGCEDGVEEHTYPPSQRTVTLPVLSRVTRPQVYAMPPNLSLFVAARNWTYNDWAGYGGVDLTFTWQPAPAATAYILTWDIWYLGAKVFVNVGSQIVPASATPSYKDNFYWEYGAILHTCLGIVTDPNTLSDPRKTGQCSDTGLYGG